MSGLNSVARDNLLGQISEKKQEIIKAIRDELKRGIDLLAEAECLVLTEPLDRVEEVLRQASEAFDFQTQDDSKIIKRFADVARQIRESENY